jgi:hypothetical protein
MEEASLERDTIGIDNGKTEFHLVGPACAARLRKKFSRKRRHHERSDDTRSISEQRFDFHGASVSNVVPSISSTLDQLETAWESGWTLDIQTQSTCSIKHKVSEVSGRMNVGWGICISRC